MTEQPKGLESKWWYRLLRVILLPLYGVVLVVAWLLMYDDKRPRTFADEERSLIVCDNGKTHAIAEIPGAAWSLTHRHSQLDGYEATQAKILCTYGQRDVPEHLAGRKMHDGVWITGVPLPWEVLPSGITSDDIEARYQRWRSLTASQDRQPKVYLDDTGNPIGGETFTNLRPVRLPFHALYGYTLKVVLETEGSWAGMLSYMAIAWLLIHLTFVAVRGAVLYAAVGKFLPPRGLRGWLVP